jgi:hypothetical protein
LARLPGAAFGRLRNKPGAAPSLLTSATGAMHSEDVRCQFHSGSTASLSVNLDKGLWKCHACGNGGGIREYEVKKLDTEDPAEAWRSICIKFGVRFVGKKRGAVATSHIYKDEDGDPISMLKRYEDGSGFWHHCLDGKWKRNLETSWHKTRRSTWSSSESRSSSPAKRVTSIKSRLFTFGARHSRKFMSEGASVYEPHSRSRSAAKPGRLLALMDLRQVVREASAVPQPFRWRSPSARSRIPVTSASI